MPLKFKDAKSVRNFDIETYTKGFVATSELDGKIYQEYFQFKEIHKIVHYPETGVEIILINGTIRVFYNDDIGQSQILFDALNNTMTSWMNSNLN